jgi:signal recognition particle GTPase
MALLDADVALPVVKAVHLGGARAGAGRRGESGPQPRQQVVKIVNEELVGILGGQTRPLAFAKNPPTVIMLAGLQGPVRPRWPASSATGSRSRATRRCSWPPTCSAPTP